jgi:hypothetical protein
MRLEHIRIDNFRGLSQVNMPFSRFGCLIGENNAGKSSVFQALNMFLRSGSATPTDFLTSALPVRIQLTFAGINEADLLRLEEGHRARIEPAIHDGRLALARIYTGPGKGVVRLVKKVPKDLRYQRPTLDEILKPKITDEELAERVRLTYPEIHATLLRRPEDRSASRAGQRAAALSSAVRRA